MRARRIGTSLLIWRCRVVAFNGEIPGPTIEASAGDTPVVRLHNSLPEPTTIHRQGLRVPAAMDGTEMIQHPMTLRASAS